MSAVAVEVARGEIQGRGHELLQTWALYRRGGDRQHSPVTSCHYDEPLDREHENEPEYVIEIDRMLGSLFRAGYGESVDIVKRFYLSNFAVWDVAEKCHKTEGFVRLTLRGVCALAEQRVPE